MSVGHQREPDFTCTAPAFRTMMAIQRELPEKLIMPSTGTRVVFGG